MGPSVTLRNPEILLNEPGIPQGGPNGDKQETKKLLLLPHPYVLKVPPQALPSTGPTRRLEANGTGHREGPHGWKRGEDKMAERKEAGGGERRQERGKGQAG